MITVANLRMKREGVYIGRANGQWQQSPLANPFKISRCCTREQAIAQYRLWLWQQMQSDTPAFRELLRIQQLAMTTDVTLLCWCKPQACHGDIIVNATQWLNKDRGAA